ncbi:hypothetical protein LIER_21662 [Lithospermum erythrorhizon]|uniref:Uncharacterized protein n=1 Tax=Lithospermum erythrorhizon TaxID=34254 RepID=A0AAV3QTE9_LITER
MRLAPSNVSKYIKGYCRYKINQAPAYVHRQKNITSRRPEDDNHHQEDDARSQNVQGPIHIGSARTLPEGGSSHPLEMEGLIQGLTDQILCSVMDQLKERLPHLRGETLMVSSFVRYRMRQLRLRQWM